MKGITRAISVILTGLSLMTGCGSNQGQVPMTTPETLTHISGKVAPGSVKNGRVTASELDHEGNILWELGWTDTDEYGAYTIFIEKEYSGGVILLKLQPNDDTQMKCPSLNGCPDADFGEWMPLATDFTMNAVSAPHGETATANITPLTHMAAARVLSSDQVTAEAAIRANSEISQMVGVNVLTCDIEDITHTETLNLNRGSSLRHALFLTGIADYMAKSGSGSYNDKLQGLADSFQAGTLRSDMTRDILDRVKHAMADVTGIMDFNRQYSGDMIMGHTALESIVSTLDSSRDYDPEPSDGAGKSSVAQAKLLLSQARTFVMQIIEHQEEPLSSMRLESVSINSFMGRDTHYLVRVLGETLCQVLENLDLPGLVHEEVVSIVDKNQAAIGDVRVAIEQSAGDMAWLINGDLWEGSPIRIHDFYLKTSFDTDGLPDLESLMNDDVLLFVDGHIGNEAMAIHFQNTGLTVSIREGSVAKMVFKGSVTIRLADRTFSGEAQLSWAAADGSLTTQQLSWTRMDDTSMTPDLDAINFDSLSMVDLEPVVDTDTIRFDTSRIALKGSKTIFYDSLSQTTQMALESYASICHEDFDQTVSMALSYPNQGQVLLRCDGTDSEGLPIQNSLSFDMFDSLSHDLTKDIIEKFGGLLEPSQLVFHTDNFDQTPVIALTYTLTPNDLDEFFFTGHLTMTATTVIPDMPALTATLSLSRTNVRGGSLSMTIGYKGKNYTLYFESRDLSADRIGTLILSNPDGVKFIIYANQENYKESYGTVYVGNDIVGQIQIANGIPLVRYVDGTFESLF